MKNDPDAQILKQVKGAADRAWQDQRQWLPLWRELNEGFYPFLYKGLRNNNPTMSINQPPMANTKMIDGEPADALYVLAAGFMNGVTSPARKWVRIKRSANVSYDEADDGQDEYHSQVQNVILDVLGGSNYYEARAVQVWDGAGLGTSIVLCYEDYETVCKFVVLPPGSYAISTDEYNVPRKIARKMAMRWEDVLAEFGEDNVGPKTAERIRKEPQFAANIVEVNHLIEENNKEDEAILANSQYREFFWLTSKGVDGKCFLDKRPLYEWPAGVFRWHCPDNSSYGVPPTMTAKGKAIQLQNLEYKSDQGLDKMISPPLIADHSLRNRPKAFQAGGITYASNLTANVGARPLMQVQVPFQELEIKRQKIVESIRNSLHNKLFQMISQLDTVRSATEIDARREEQLVQLGPVLQRSYTEDIGMIINRVIGICSRKGLLPEAQDGQTATVVFSNILSDVQKASDVSTIERFFTFAGQQAAIFPTVQQKVNATELLKQYAEGLGIRPNGLNADEVVQQAGEEQGQMQELMQMSEVARNFAPAASVAAETDVGGGLEAIQAML